MAACIDNGIVHGFWQIRQQCASTIRQGMVDVRQRRQNQQQGLTITWTADGPRHARQLRWQHVCWQWAVGLWENIPMQLRQFLCGEEVGQNMG